MTTRNDEQHESAGPLAGSEPTLRQRAEEQVRAEETQELAALSPEETRRLVHELRVHQIELEMQNQDLRRAQLELEVSWARYFDLYDLAPVGYLTVSQESSILEANLTAATLLGVARGALVRQPLTRYILPEDQDIYYLHRKQLLDTGEPQAWELRLVRPDGNSLWVRAEGILATDADSQTPVCRIVMSDITARKRVEGQLTRLLERLNLATRTAHLGIWDWDIQNDELVWDDRMYEFYGVKREDFAGAYQAWLAGIHPDDRAASDEVSRQARRGERDYDTEFRVVWPDGTVRVLKAYGQVLWDPAGQPQRMIGINHDITERKQAEKEIAQLAKFPSENPNPVLRVAPDGTIIYANKASVPLLSNWECQAGQRLPDHWREFASDVLGSESSRAAEAETRDRVFSLVFAPVVEAGYVNVYGLDITERKQAEQERERLLAQVREQARRVQAILDTVPDGVLLLDAERRVLLANPAAQEALALLAEAGQDQPLARLGSRPLVDLLAPPPPGQRHEVRAGGHIFEALAHPIPDDEPQRWVLALADVTQAREVRARLEQQERLAAVGQLSAGIAHDFNNILGGVILAADMLWHQQRLAPEAEGMLQRIKGQSQRAAHLVQQLLDFSRKSLRRLEPFDLDLLLQEWFENSQQDTPSNVDVRLDMGPGPYLIQADRAQIQQIMANLAARARGAMPNGGTVIVGLRDLELTPDQLPPVPDMPPGKWLALTVADTGVAIPPELLPHIFEPFFTTRGISENMGLVLAQVYGIVMQHEGHIRVTSQEEGGTRFTIYLPALKAEPRAEERADDLPRGNGETILLVIADELLLAASRVTLEDLGYRALAAQDSEAALALLDEHRDDVALVLMDAALPDTGATGLGPVLTQMEPQTKTVLVTQHPLTDAPHDLRGRGARYWIQRPFTAGQLARTLHTVLSGETAQGGNPQPSHAR